jgi:hypothetical protein
MTAAVFFQKQNQKHEDKKYNLPLKIFSYLFIKQKQKF